MADHWRNDDRGYGERDRAFRDRNAWERGGQFAGDRFEENWSRGDDRRQDFGRESDYGAGYAMPRPGFNNLNQRPGGMSDRGSWGEPRPPADPRNFAGYRGDYRSSPPDYQDYADWQGPGSFGGDFYRDRDTYGRGYGRSFGSQGRGYWHRAPDYGDPRQVNRDSWNRPADNPASWSDDDLERRHSMDRAQGHAGKGPRGYVRSDDRIREDVNDRLTDDWHIDAGDIVVTVSGGEVTLAGTVSSRDIKRHAEDITESISGVKHVQNNLRVTGLETQPVGSQAGNSAGTGFNPRPGSSANLGTGPNNNVSH